MAKQVAHRARVPLGLASLLLLSLALQLRVLTLLLGSSLAGDLSLLLLHRCLLLQLLLSLHPPLW